MDLDIVQEIEKFIEFKDTDYNKEDFYDANIDSDSEEKLEMKKKDDNIFSLYTQGKEGDHVFIPERNFLIHKSHSFNAGGDGKIAKNVQSKFQKIL